MPLLEVRDLGVRFGGLAAVDGVHFALEVGEILGLIGPNGAGKTTCFNLITGLLRPERGRVTLREREITGLSLHRIAREGLARTFQKTSLFPRLTVLENVMIGQQARLRPRVGPALLRTRGQREEMAALAARAEEVLGFLDMLPLGGATAQELPYGEQRRLAIAIALAGRPTLLLLDEPAAGLTPAESQRLMGLIGRIRDDGTTVLLVEHDMKVVMGICDRIVVLDGGRKIAEGKPHDIRKNPEVIRVYLGEAAARA